MGKHTPTPWEVRMVTGFHTSIYGEKNKWILNAALQGMKRDESEANAAHIVKCVNMHDELVKALEFYANKEEWHNNGEYGWKLQFNSAEVDGDGWSVADEVLKKLKGE